MVIPCFKLTNWLVVLRVIAGVEQFPMNPALQAHMLLDWQTEFWGHGQFWLMAKVVVMSRERNIVLMSYNLDYTIKFVLKL